MAGVGALYVHVPFCRRRCAYCDFATAAIPVGDPMMEAYIAGIISLIDEISVTGILTDALSAYIGGGTPSFVGGHALAALLASLTARAPRLRELTVEANPDSLTADLLLALHQGGATRISLGVQSLHDQELRALGRAHDAAQALLALDGACKAGLDVSADVMCALPYQSDASLARTLEAIVATGVSHVSVYPLALEEGTPLAARVEAAGGRAPWNDADLAAERMELAAGILAGAGLPRYEVASYARSGKSCVHNRAYWTGVAYLGVGSSAASMLDADTYDALRASVLPQLPVRPVEAVRARLVSTASAAEIALGSEWRELGFDLEFLNRRQAVAEDLMLGMRLVAGVDASLCAYAREVIGPAADSAFAGLVARKLARWQGGRYVPTERGWLLGNELYGELWGLAGAPVAELSCDPGRMSSDCA